jgi:hypothetical protein
LAIPPVIGAFPLAALLLDAPTEELLFDGTSSADGGGDPRWIEVGATPVLIAVGRPPPMAEGGALR